MSDSTESILVLVGLGLLLIFSAYVKYRRSKNEPLGRVATILIDLNKNIKLIENFTYRSRSGRLRTASWAKNREHVAFLPESLRMKLAQLFPILEEINEKIDAGRQYKSNSYMASIDLTQVKEPLESSKQELVIWLRENLNNPQYQPKRRGMFGGFLRR